MNEFDDDRGGVALLTLVGAMLLAAVGMVVVVAATDLMVAQSRASTAADAAALAAVGASPLAGGDGDGDPQWAAYRLARENGAELDTFDDTGWPRHATVAVHVQTRMSLLRTMAPTVRAAARAELVPDPSAAPTGQREP
jgi:hypothetical protein